MFRYYLLGGDTAAPSGLYTRLCHAFLVFIFVFWVIFFHFYRMREAGMQSLKKKQNYKRPIVGILKYATVSMFTAATIYFNFQFYFLILI